MTLEKLQVIIEAYTKPYRDELEKVKKQTTATTSHVDRQTSKMATSFKKVAAVVAMALSITAIVAFGKSCIDLGSQLAEVDNVIQQAVPSMSKEIDSFAKNAIEQFGMSEISAKRYTGVFASMARGFGYAEESAAVMSTTLTGLVADVASFYDTSQSEAFTKLKSVFTGETESLKDLGVVMTQSALDAYALANGYGKTVKSMSEAEKVALRYAFVQEKLRFAQGDFARNSHSWANQVRILSEQFNALKATIGQGLINAFTPVIQVINTILARLQTLASYFKAFTTALFGSAGSGGGSVSETMDSAAGASGTVADNMGKAAGAAKKLKEYTLGIDELNILSPDDGDGDGSGGDPGGGGVPDFGNFSGELFSDVTVNPKVEEAARKIKEMLDAIKVAAEPTKEALKRLWDEGLAKLGTFVWTGLKDFWNEFLVPLGKWVLGEGLPKLLNVLNDLMVAINWDKLNESLKSLWKALAPFAIAVGDGLIAFIQGLAKVLTPGLSALVDIFSLCLSGLAKVIAAIPPETVSILTGAIAGLVTAILLFNGVTSAISAIKNIGVAISGIVTAMSAHPILLAAAALGALAGAFLTMEQNWNNKVAKEYSDFIDKMSPSTKVITDHIKALKDFSDRAKDIVKDATTEGKSLDILRDKYFNLAEKITLTREEQELLQHYSNELVARIPELNDKIDTTTGRYKGQRKEIINLINAQKDYQMAIAYGNILAEYNEALARATINLRENNDERRKLSKEYSSLLSIQKNAIDQGWGEYTLIEKTGLTYKGLAEKVAFYEQAIEDNRLTNIEYRNEMDNVTNTIGNVEQALAESQIAYKETQKSIDELDFASMTVNAANAIDEMHGLWSEDGIQILGQDALNIYNQIISTFDDLDQDFYKLADGAVVRFGNSIEDGTPGVVSTLNNEFLKSINNILSTQGKIIGTTNGKLIISDFISGADSKRNDLFKAFEGYAAYSEEGFRNKMKELRESVTPKAMKDFAQYGIMNPFAEALEIHSPSRIFAGYAKNVVDGFNDGIASNQGSSRGFIRDWVDKIKDWFTDMFDINSPSKVFAGYGGYLIEGLNAGIDESKSSTLDKLNGFSSMIEGWANGVNIPPISVGFNMYEPAFSANGDITSSQNSNVLLTDYKTVRRGNNSDSELISVIRETFGGKDMEEQNLLLKEQNDLLSAILEKDTSIQVDGREILSSTTRTTKRQGYRFKK